jgi:hypothetical protein
MPDTVFDEEIMCDIAKDRMISDLCLQWYILHTKNELTEQEQAEKLRIHNEIIQFNKKPL